MNFYTSITGIDAAVNRLDVSSNNIANAQTDTFKKSRVNFHDIYTLSPTQLPGISIGDGSNVATINQNFSQGSLISTINTLDLAISGDGFYVMQDKNNKDFYSRVGQFQLADDGLLINSDGDRVMGAKGVAIPNNGPYELESVKINRTIGQSPEGDLSSIDIGKDGVVSAVYNNGHIEKVATLILVKFNNPQGLTQLGDTKYLKTTSSGPEMANRPGYGGLGSLRSGAIEQSNVDVTTELVDLIEAQRNFQSNSKAIETIDKMIKAMIDR